MRKTISPSQVTDDHVFVAANSRFLTPYQAYDDGYGKFWICRNSTGIVGIIRAVNWSTAYNIAEDVFFPAADEDARKAMAEIGAATGSERRSLQTAFDENYGYRSNSLTLPDGSRSLIYSKDLNGDFVDPLTDAFATEAGITLEVEDRFVQISPLPSPPHSEKAPNCPVPLIWSLRQPLVHHG